MSFFVNNETERLCLKNYCLFVQVVRVLRGQGDQWDNRARARGVTASFSLNGIGLMPEETADLYQENEELKVYTAHCIFILYCVYVIRILFHLRSMNMFIFSIFTQFWLFMPNVSFNVYFPKSKQPISKFFKISKIFTNSKLVN